MCLLLVPINGIYIYVQGNVEGLVVMLALSPITYVSLKAKSLLLKLWLLCE